MNITVLNTGGTFNKKYNPIKGELEVLSDSSSLDKITSICHNINFDIKNIISKDSLDMTNDDRDIMVKEIQNSQNQNIIIVHGTDTMNITAKYLDERIKNKNIILTGTMIPMSIDEIEATINYSSAIGFLNAEVKNGVYIAMHGAVVSYEKIYKDKSIGKFLKNDN